MLIWAIGINVGRDSCNAGQALVNVPALSKKRDNSQ
jgi:hypothetical protein